jgi:hypothetical protein
VNKKISLLTNGGKDLFLIQIRGIPEYDKDDLILFVKRRFSPIKYLSVRKTGGGSS